MESTVRIYPLNTSSSSTSTVGADRRKEEERTRYIPQIRFDQGTKLSDDLRFARSVISIDRIQETACSLHYMKYAPQCMNDIRSSHGRSNSRKNHSLLNRLFFILVSKDNAIYV